MCEPLPRQSLFQALGDLFDRVGTASQHLGQDGSQSQRDLQSIKKRAGRVISLFLPDRYELSG
jgi:hypothetical protein